jgi:hypothetical protein
MKRQRTKKVKLKMQSRKNRGFLSNIFAKEGQLKIQEMAFMLVALLIFFGLVAVFALSILYKSVYNSATEIAEQKTVAAVENLAGTAEFICANNKPNCVDEEKVMALKDKKAYESFWEFSSLSIIKSSGLSKKEGEMIECTLASYPNCDLIRVHDKNVQNERVTSSFVALCRREYENNYPYEKCEIAKLIAGTEVKVVSGK